MNNNETNIVTRTAKGTPVTDTIQVARIFRNGKTNNVYRMAKRLAGMPAYKNEFYDNGKKPANIIMTRKGFTVLIGRMFRKADKAQTQEKAASVIADFERLGATGTTEQFLSFDDMRRQHPDAVKNLAAAKEDFERAMDEHIERNAPASNDIKDDIRKFFEKSPVIAVFEDLTDKQDKFEKAYIELNKAYAIARERLESFVLNAIANVASGTKVEPEKKTPAHIKTTSDNILVHDLAVMAAANGVNGIGEIRLYQWLRDAGYLCAVGDSYNMPTQRSIDLGVLSVKHSQYEQNGKVHKTTTTVVTPKGQQYFINKLLFNQENNRNNQKTTKNQPIQ
jgi:phage antirepressor YoqD-like protein